jgi:hypothetical protein
MTIAEVQFTGIATGTTSAVTATNASNVTSGHSLVLITQGFGVNSLANGAVTDTQSGTWTLAFNLSDGVIQSDQFTIWVCNNPASGVEHAVTWTMAAASLYGSCAWLGEYSGGPLAPDAHGYNAIANAAASLSTPSLAPNFPNELFIASASDNSGSSSWTITGSWTYITDGAPNVLDYYIATGSGSQEASWDISPSDSGIGVIASLYSTSAGANTAGLLPMMGYSSGFTTVTNYTVTFNANGGTGSMSNQTDSSPTALTTNAYTYTNYTYTGWNTAANGSGTAYANGATYPFTANATLYAQWTLNSTYPSGLTPPAIPEGYELSFFDDFLGTSLNTSNWDVWSGTSHAVSDGYWLPSHVVVGHDGVQDSILHLQAYQDTASGSGNAGNLYWTCGGIGWAGQNEYPPGVIINVAMKQAPYANLTAIAILIGANNWPPEIDFVESGTGSGTTIDGFTATAHYGSGNSQVQYSAPSNSMTAWGMWGIIWTPPTISYTYNNVVWKEFTNPDQNYSDVYSLVQNMTMGLQYQTGDIGSAYPPNDGTVTASNPMEMQVDWIQICVPT